MSLGKNIAKLRKYNKFTQQSLADKVGVSRGSMSMYELDKNRPNDETLIKIANYLKVGVDYLTGDSTSNLTEHVLGNLDDLSKKDIKVLQKMIRNMRRKQSID